MSDQVKRAAEDALRTIKRDFVFSFRGKAKVETPSLILRIAERPQAPYDGLQKDMVIPPAVFTVLRELLLKPNALRVFSFQNPNFPWFDLIYEGTDQSLTFTIGVVHPISELKSAV